MFAEGVPVSHISKRVRRGVPTINKWVHSDWWKSMYREHLLDRQRIFQAKLTQMNEKILDGYVDVMDSRDARTAMARIQGAKAYMEMGDDPLIKKQPNTVVNNNTLIQAGSLDTAKINELSEDELLEAARTGIIPDKIKKVEE